ncbi:hypothetical protein L218DRAFT_366858 [Marasmius fiardii PR-910]|nr:hypothetical protein L218DRAFT_366858 [Marasmius fiardii PR-910]
MEKVKPETKASKNRHTRPCRYFQTNSCNKTADECDFAHIFADDSVKQRHAKPCRFYQAGFCRNGDSCLFRHHGTVDSERSVEDEITKESPRSFSSDESSKPSHLPPLYIPPTPGSSPPAYWPMYDHVVSLRYYSDKVPYCFPAMPPTNVPITAEPVAPDHRNAVNRLRSRSKAKMYKTKPCKFYKTPDGCPKGDECTLPSIHEDFEKRIVPTSSPGRPELPQKPLSPLEESRKRGFYPITWRVIGGGVLMGVHKPHDPDEGQSGDESLTPRNQLTPNFNRSTVTSENARPGALTKDPAADPNLRKRHSALPAVLTHLNVNVLNVSSSRSSSPSPRTRARANSIPSTPRITQVNPTALFAAAELP